MARNAKEYNIALIEKPLDEGLTKAEVMDLYDMLSSPEAIPVEFQGECSTAMGFINLTDAEWMDYDYSKVEEVVVQILNNIDNERPDNTYEVPNKHGVSVIWLSRR